MAPSIHSANVIRTGGAQLPFWVRTHMTGAASALRAQYSAGSPVTEDGRLRTGSAPNMVRIRPDTHVEHSPRRWPELANNAESTGPSACNAAHRLATRSGWPASTHTCKPADAHIHARPSGP